MEDNYENIPRPYDAFLQRTAQSAGQVTDTSQVVNTTNVTTTNSGGTSGVNGSVQTATVKSDGAMADVWISNFIRSQNWMPKSAGFFIDGQSGKAEFTNVYISGDIQALTGHIGGFVIGSTDLTATSGGNTTILSSGPIAFSAGPTGSPTVTITQAGALTALSGSIGGWDIQSTLLRSATSGARIELNEGLSRISVFDAVNEKVAMGYLNGLPKHDGSGNWGVGDYGFWARAGNKLSIDGDGEYTNGDWIIQHDAAYLINDASNNTIVRLGTDTGEIGLFIYNNVGTKLAKFTSNEIYVGDVTNHLSYDTINGLIITGSVSATTGAIGGFNIGTDYVRDTSDSFGLSSTSTGGNDVRLWAGASFANRDTAPFRVYEDGSIGGLSLTVTQLDLPDLTTASSFHVDSSGNAWWGTNTATGYASAPAKILNTGAATFTSATITGALTAAAGSSIATSYLSGTIAQNTLDLADRGWTQTCAFSSSGSNIVVWTAGTFTSADGTQYSIYSGSTGAMSTKTYIYFQPGGNDTIYQSSTNSADAVGAGKVLIAVAENGPSTATYALSETIQIVGDNILANSINASKITTGSLVVGTNVGIGTAAATADMTTIVGGIVTTSYLNAKNITAGSVAAENITGTTISGKTITGATIIGSTLSTAGNQHVSITSTNASFYDSNNTYEGKIEAIVGGLYVSGTVVAGLAINNFLYFYSNGPSQVNVSTVNLVPYTGYAIDLGSSGAYWRNLYCQTGYFAGNISASNFSGYSVGTNTGDQNLSAYATTSYVSNGFAAKSGASFYGPVDTVNLYTNWLLAIGGSPQIGNAYGRFFIYASTVRYTSLVNDSDRALKQNIVDLSYGLDSILALKPVSFEYKDTNNGEKHLGFIAQDVETVIPELVSNNDNGMKGLSSTEMIPILTKAIQQLNDRIKILESKV